MDPEAAHGSFAEVVSMEERGVDNLYAFNNGFTWCVCSILGFYFDFLPKLTKGLKVLLFLVFDG